MWKFFNFCRSDLRMWGLNFYALVFQILLRVLCELLLWLRWLSYFSAAWDLLIDIVKYRRIGPGSFTADSCLNYCLRILRWLMILLLWLHNLFAFLLLLKNLLLRLLWFWYFWLRILVSDRELTNIVHLWFKFANVALFLVLYKLLLSFSLLRVFLSLSNDDMLLTHQNLLFFLWVPWVRPTKDRLRSSNSSQIVLNHRMIHVCRSSLVAPRCNFVSHFQTVFSLLM